MTNVIHDAKVEVTCDGANCSSFVVYEPPFVHADYSGTSGQYDVQDDAIERWLTREQHWLVKDGNHYCDAGCVPD